MTFDQQISTGNEWEQRYGYSRGVRCGDMIFLTGTVSINDDGTPHVPDDGYAQAMRCFEIIERAVVELGGQKSDLVRSRVYVTDISRSDEFGRAHKDFFGEHSPCLTMVEVRALIDPAFLVEIECEAVVSAHSKNRLSK